MVALIIIGYIIVGTIVGSIAYVFNIKDENTIYSDAEAYYFFIGFVWPFAIAGLLLLKLIELISYYTINTLYIKLHKTFISNHQCFVCKHYKNRFTVCKTHSAQVTKCENFKKDKFWKFKHVLK